MPLDSFHSLEPLPRLASALRRALVHPAGLAVLASCAPLGAGVKDGMLDLGFTPEVSGHIWSITAIGDFYYVGSDSVYRFRRDGTLDTSFQCAFVADNPYDAFKAIRPTPDGGLIVAGDFHDETTFLQVAKIDATGSVDRNFVNNFFGPLVSGSTVIDSLVDASGRIYVTGVFQSVNETSCRHLVRLLPDGSVDSGFAVPTEVSVAAGGSALTADDRLLVITGNSTAIARLSDDGSVDTSFVFPSGFTSIVNIRVGADGRIAVPARQYLDGRYFGPNVYVFTPSGALDTTFESAFQFSTRPDDCLWDGDRLLVSGWWSVWAARGNHRTDQGIVRLTRDGAIDPDWTTSALAEAGFRYATLDSDGAVVAVGRYVPELGTVEERLVRLNPGSATELKWLNTSARSIVTPTDPLIVGFVVGGNAPQRLLVRGVGPSLAQFGITNPLPQPVIRVHRGDEQLLEESDWRNSPGVGDAAEAVWAFPLLSLCLDAAETIVLPPGTYTLVLSSGDGSSGTALAEVYSMDVN